MRIEDAIADLAEIRTRLNRSETYRGYRSVTVGVNGLLAFAGATIQTWWLPDPVGNLEGYVSLWVSIAVVCASLTGIEIGLRMVCESSSRFRYLTRLAVEQFLPSLAAGALVTSAIVLGAPEFGWALPGLWSIVFGLGVASSARLLPRATVWVAVHYLVVGTICLFLGPGQHALAPWMMVATFGVGQVFAAAVLYFGLERGA